MSSARSYAPFLLALASAGSLLGAAWRYRQSQKAKQEAVKGFTVQLLFSDGGVPKYRESFWEFYTIALTPFVLGVPSSQVDLILAEGFRGLGRDEIENVEADAATVDGKKIMPDGYKDYFVAVYSRASTREELPLDTCSLRIISGHGFGNFKGGDISIGGTAVWYPDLGKNATCLTILDICNAAYAVAHFEGKVPGKKRWHRFQKNAVFEGEPTVPVVCDKSDATWAFRVGYNGQHSTSSSPDENLRMSKPIGDSVAASFLHAVKSFIEGQKQGSLDQLFRDTYSSLNTTLLSDGADHPRPHSSLAIMQGLLTDGTLPVRMEAFRSPFFQLQAEWFLTMERPLSLTEQDGEIAEEIINFIVNGVIEWHQENIDGEEVDSQMEWQGLMNSMGPFRQELKAVRLLYREDGSIVRAQGDEGLAMEAWASSCGGLSDILSKVKTKVLSGEFQ